MGCPERQAKLADWVLEELSPAEAQELELHVEQCADCARSLASWRGVRQVLGHQLSDREMPAHLVFLGKRQESLATGFIASLWRTAALAAVAAGVLLVVLLGGYAAWGNRLPAGARAEKVTLTRLEVESMIARAIEKSAAQQMNELRAANEKLAASLQEEQGRSLAAVARQVQYLGSAQVAVWKETQQQGALMQLIARNSLRGEPVPAGKP